MGRVDNARQLSYKNSTHMMLYGTRRFSIKFDAYGAKNKIDTYAALCSKKTTIFYHIRQIFYQYIDTFVSIKYLTTYIP